MSAARAGARRVAPYFDNGQCVIYHGLAEDVLPTLGRESIDLLLTDPPYGVKWAGKSGRKNQQLGLIENDGGDYDVVALLGETFGVLKNHRHFYVFGPFDLSSLPVGGTAELIWDKCVPGPAAPGPWQYQHEYIQFGVSVSRKSGREAGDGNVAARLRRGSVLRYPRQNGGSIGRHPTEKPVDLLRELIESSSRIGETVLDPFMGSGSTLVAAQIEGRRAIGIEVDERYCAIAAERLAQLPLIGAIS